MVSIEAPNRLGPGLRRYACRTCSTAPGGAAAGRAFEARPVADHGEVAAFRAGISFEPPELRLESEAESRRGCLSERDADDGRLGA